MKLVLTMKTPNAIDNALDREKESIAWLINGKVYHNLVDEQEFDERLSPMRKLMEKYVEYGEVVRIEFDSETGEAKVLPIK